MPELIAAILGVVEGLTEFIPVSSTGHLILAGHLLEFKNYVGKDVADCFDIFIQLGAILAVIVAYPQRFARLADLRQNRGLGGFRGLGLLAASTIPPAVVALVARSFIKQHLFNPLTVAIGLAVGAVWILLLEGMLAARQRAEAWERSGLPGGSLRLLAFLLPRPKRTSVDEIGWQDAFSIGLFQCLALWPGMSRSSSTILGGMMLGVERKAATEYSFFAAVPLLAAAGLYELYKSLPVLSVSHVPLFAIGFGVSFVFAWLAVKFFIGFLGRHTLVAFGWYRVVLAAVVFWTLRGQVIS